jgi:septal ring factor EnvC (AmiA/AmiB activator)
MDTSTSQERKKREIHSLRTKTREIRPTASARKNAEARRNRAFRERKRGTEKICPPCMVEDGSPL